MEFMSDIMNGITTVGFPIMMCLILMFYVKDQADKHKEEIDTLRTSIENNTLALTKLYEKMGD